MKIAFTGHRPPRLGGYVPNSLHYKCKQAINEIYDSHIADDSFEVISGMAQGIDLWAAEAALDRGIHLVAALPYKGMGERWPTQDKTKLFELLERANRTHIVCAKYSKISYVVRDKWMVDHCEKLYAFWDGQKTGGTWITLNYAMKNGVDYEIIRTDELF
jgi:uncharacterized phage-like protein YoqJ